MSRDGLVAFSVRVSRATLTFEYSETGILGDGHRGDGPVYTRRTGHRHENGHDKAVGARKLLYFD